MKNKKIVAAIIGAFVTVVGAAIFGTSVKKSKKASNVANEIVTENLDIPGEDEIGED